MGKAVRFWKLRDTHEAVFLFTVMSFCVREQLSPMRVACSRELSKCFMLYIYP